MLGILWGITSRYRETWVVACTDFDPDSSSATSKEHFPEGRAACWGRRVAHHSISNVQPKLPEKLWAMDEEILLDRDC